MASGTIKSNIKICTLGDFTISANQYLLAGTLPQEYQGARAYIITATFNGAYMSGGVNEDYQIYLFNNYSVQLTFSGVKVVCIY
jgi:hypothetical protein